MLGQTSESNQLIDPNSGEFTQNVKSFKEAFQDFKSMVQDNKQRTEKNAQIQRKRDGEQPWRPQKLKAAGQDWRSNRPTGFMASLLKRITPPYKQMVNQLPILTYSKFPNQKIGTHVEEDKFHKRITDTIRKGNGWGDFVSQLVDENYTFGYAAVTADDEYEWKPNMLRSDEVFFPVGTPQEASKTKLWGRKQDIKTDEVVKILLDMESAQAAGWVVKNLIKKLNFATPQFNDKTGEDYARVQQDLIRENAYAGTFTSALKVLKVGHTYNIDMKEGSVNHYMFDRDDGTPLFFRRHQYAKMEHSLCLFSAEVGDRTLQGSRGAGRALYNTHVSVEQARNLIQDAFHLAGLLVLKKTVRAGSGTTVSNALTVMHPFAMIGDGYEVIEKVKFELNAEAFIALDKQATAQAEILVGAFMPGVSDAEGEARTASEVNYVASIETQIRAEILSRFADQLFELTGWMQRRICHPDVVTLAEQIFNQVTQSGNLPIFDSYFFQSLVDAGADEGFEFFEIPGFIDHDALDCCIGLFEDGLDKRQILVLANQSPRSNVDDSIASQSGVLDLILASYANDPLINRVELVKRHLSSKIGSDAAEELMNVDASPLSPIKQVRGQLSELATMLSGNEVPVDPTDDDLVHLQTLAQGIQPMLKEPALSVLTQTAEFLGRVVTHAEAHIDAGIGKGAKEAEFAPYRSIIDQVKQMISVPPIEQQAQDVMAQATGPGMVPGIQAVTAPVASPQNVLAEAASPAEPTPPRPEELATSLTAGVVV